MKIPRYLPICSFLLIAAPVARADETSPKLIESPDKSISIRQEYEGNYKETLLFSNRDLKPVELSKGEFPWASVYNFAPDEKAILRTQKSGSGDNIAMLYLIGQDGKVEEVAGFNDSLWKLADSLSPLKEKDLFHTGVSQASWSPDSTTLRIVLRGSDAKVSGAGIEFPIIYDLKAKTFRMEPAPVVPAKSSAKQ